MVLKDWNKKVHSFGLQWTKNNKELWLIKDYPKGYRVRETQLS